jgi:hypothetical protein
MKSLAQENYNALISLKKDAVKKIIIFNQQLSALRNISQKESYFTLLFVYESYYFIANTIIMKQ